MRVPRVKGVCVWYVGGGSQSEESRDEIRLFPTTSVCTDIVSYR